MGDSNWCLIESDPGVFTELIKGFGVDGIECEEVYDLINLDNVSDALGFIFLFKWESKQEMFGKYIDENPKSVFFAKQVIKNACATQAIINVLLNIKSDYVELGDTLTELKSFVNDFDSSLKGSALTNSEKIRSVHNSFSSPQMFELDDSRNVGIEESYHFIGYVPIDGVIYELDGLKQAPIELKRFENNSWVEALKPILTERFSKCVDGKFNLMAIVPNRLKSYELKLSQCGSMDITDQEYINQLKLNIECEKKKVASQRSENIRRRHNYLPLIVELLKILSERGRLVNLIKSAKKKALSPSPNNAPVNA